MITFTCSECDGDTWIVRGAIGPLDAVSPPQIKEIECDDCGNVEEAA